MPNPFISILCPVRNVAPYIEETIQSVLAQSYKDWEMIIMDGASTDGTLEIVRRYTDKYPNIRFYSEPDECSWHAVDKMFDLAWGEFITIVCGQDGFLDPEWLMRVSDILKHDPSLSLVWGLSRAMTEQGVLSSETHPSYSHFIEQQTMKHGVYNVFNKIGDIIKDILSRLRENPMWAFWRLGFWLKKLLRTGTMMRINLMVDRGFEDGKIPQKEQWFAYWLKTALVFPDQSMVVHKKVFLDCVPRYKMGSRTLGYMMDFYFNFNAKGYLAYFVPMFGTFGRIHATNSSERATGELHVQFKKYLSDVDRFKRDIIKNHKVIAFHDPAGRLVSTRSF